MLPFATMSIVPPDPDALFSSPAELARIRAEADFGLREIGPAVADLPHGARLLEIGCGTGYLLAQLSGRRPDLDLVGLEPIGKGFAKFEATLAGIEAAFSNLTVHRVPIEDFTLAGEGQGFDLIVSINVFEHLDDWRKAVDRSIELLNPNGRMIVLCPNYAIPYEPHFGIPIILGPGFTRRAFDRRIRRVERQADAEGLWRSLNFITVPELRRHCKSRRIALEFDRGVMARMLERLDTDPEFASRQAAVARLARLLRSLGLAWMSRRLPAVFSPYMKAVLSRGGTGKA